MKKIALTSLVAALAVSSANAATNYFVGGSAAVNRSNDHTTVLAVAPELGWKMNSDWDFGVNASFGYFHQGDDAYLYGAGVFARYKVAQKGDVKLLLKGGVGMDFYTISSDNEDIDGETAKEINAAIIPMITYDVSESFTLYAELNFLGVNAGYTFENDKLGIDRSWSFGANFDSDNVANTGDFKIGFTYNF